MRIPASVIALSLLALVVRVVFLGHKGLWQDEVFSEAVLRSPRTRTSGRC